MQSLNQRTWIGRLLDRLPDYLTLTLIVICGSLLARLTWTVFPDPDVLARKQVQQEVVTNTAMQIMPAKAPRINEGDEVARYHLFGQVQVAALHTPEVVSKPVPTPVMAKPREPIDLVGVYALAGKDGLAILRIRGQQKVFKVDEPLVIRINNKDETIGAVLRKVTEHTVELDWGDNSKQVLTLTGSSPKVGLVSSNDMMPMDDPLMNVDPMMGDPMMNDPMMHQPIDMPQPDALKQGDLLPPPLPESLPEPTSAAPQPLSLGQFREQALNDNSRVMDLMMASPARVDGQMKGFRVNPGKNMQLFEQTGLMPGDIVTEVNGIPLNDMPSGIKALQTISKASDIQLKVLRAGATVTVERRF